DRVVARLALAQRAKAPARPEPLAQQRRYQRRGALLWHDARPQQVARVRVEDCQRALVAVQRHSVGAEVRQPERAVELLAQALRSPLPRGSLLGFTEAPVP